MHSKISDLNIIELKNDIVKALNDNGIETDVSLVCDNRDDWSMTLKISKGSFGRDKLENTVERFLSEAKVEDDRIVYFEDIKTPNSYEWYFTHPDAPKEVLEKQDREIEEEERQEEMESIRKHEEHRKLLRDQGLIIKPRNINSSNTDLFYVLNRENFEDIESGEKKIEYRTYSPYHIDKCLGRGVNGIKTLVFQLGYGGPGHSTPRKIRFKTDGIYLCDDTMEEIPAFREDGRITEERDLPDGFIPMLLAIHIGDRIK